MNIDSLSLSEIMRARPETIRVFIDWHLHCIGCPIAEFHRLADAAEEHDCELDGLRRAILLAMKDRPVSEQIPTPHAESGDDPAGGHRTGA